MRKILVLILVLLSVLLGYSFATGEFDEGQKTREKAPIVKKPVLRVALVADSGNENDLLEKALWQAQGMGINFVIGLGDFSEVGTAVELSRAKQVFDESKLDYYLTAGDHDLWDSRNRGLDARANFVEVFGSPMHVFDREKILFVILDNSDIYNGILNEDWQLLQESLEGGKDKAIFVFAHKTPFHPESAHVMGEHDAEVAKQAGNLLKLLEESKVDGFFSGDLHFFAKFSSRGGSTSGGNSPNGKLKITTIGAIANERNFQGPRFGILTVYEDESWEVEDVEIR